MNGLVLDNNDDDDDGGGGAVCNEGGGGGDGAGGGEEEVACGKLYGCGGVTAGVEGGNTATNVKKYSRKAV